MKSRKHETKGTPDSAVRTTRYLETEDGWFFRTREGVMLGPYAEQFDAEISASLLIARLAQLEPGADATSTIQRFITDPANAPLVKPAGEVTKPVDLVALKRQHRRRQSIPTLHKAWDAITAFRRQG